MTDTRKKILATVFAMLMVVSMVGAVGAPAAGTNTSGPSGMVGVPGENVDSDLPPQTPMGQTAQELEDAGVYASDHAGSLEVVVTNPGRAQTQYSGGNIQGSGPVAIVFRDDEVHEGREVAISAEVIEDVLDHRPDVVFGAHEDGEEWTREIRYEDGRAIFEIPKFSENTVTFTGGIELSGNEAGDGTSYQYELGSLDGVGNFGIDLTGVDNNQTVTRDGLFTNGETWSFDVGGTTSTRNGTVTLIGESWSETITDTGSTSVTGSFGVDVNGNLEPEGPANGDPQVTVSSERNTRQSSLSDDDVYIGNGDPAGTQDSFYISTSGVSTVDEITIHAHTNYNNQLDLRVECGGNDFGVKTLPGLTEGTWTWDEGSTTSCSTVTLTKESSDGGFDTDTSNINLDESWAEVASPEPSGISLNADGGGEYVSVGTGGTYGIDLTSDTSSIDVSGNGEGTVSYDLEYTDRGQTVDPSIDIGGKTVSHTGSLSDGETVSESIDLSPGSHDASVSTDGGVGIELSYNEVSETSDPVVEVNGYTTNYDGTLADGETTSLAANEAWLEEGTNNVTVTTSSPATGPESLVGFNYAHDASGTTRTVDVAATSWTETFNISHTYPSETAGAEATLTFVDEVAEINDVEYRIDGGEWQSPASTELNGTDLTVAFGDVPADTDIDVRATGHKVRAYDGAVNVVEPTVEGDELSTQVEITDINDEGRFGLDVSGTVLGDRIHYASDRSWSGDNAHAEVTASGTQILRADDANVGSTMTVGSSPISVEPESGAMEVVIDDVDEPRFSLRQGDTTGAATVDVTYTDTLPGERYVLWSVSQEREIDADRASSPVYFTTDGSAETYSILQRDRAGASSGGSAAQSSGSVGAPLILVLPAVMISVTGLFWAGRRFGGAEGFRGNAILLVGSTIISAAALELVTPGSMFASMWQATVYALGDAAASGLGAVIAAIVTIVGVWQLDQRTEADVPPWVLVPAVGVAIVLALEAIRPGSVLGPISEVLVEGGVLLALTAVGIYVWRRRQRDELESAEASTPETQLTLDLGSREEDD